MDFEILAQIVSSIGFPIVMAGGLFWYMNEQRKSHMEETNSLKEALDRNTEVLSELKGLFNAVVNKMEK